jgi:hypothetical protein
MSVFGHQQLSNTAWAFSTLVFLHEPLIESLSSPALRLITQFDPQGLSNTSWSFALMLFHPPEPLRNSIAAQAIPKLPEFDSQNCANLAWSYALLVVFHATLIDAIAAPAIRTISDFSCQSLANTAWAFANLQIMDMPLLYAISSAASRMLSEIQIIVWPRNQLISFALGLLGIAWAHAFLEVESFGLGSALQRSLMSIGKEVDRRDRQVALL